MCIESIINITFSDEYWSVCVPWDQQLISPHLLMIYFNWFDCILPDGSVSVVLFM